MSNRKGQNYSGNQNSFAQKNNSNRQGDSNRKQNAGSSGSGYRKPKGGNFGGGNRGGMRGCKGFRGTGTIYNHQDDWTPNRQYTENEYHQENAYQRSENSFDDPEYGAGFKKFRDSNPQLKTHETRSKNFSTRNANNYTWYRDSHGDLPIRQEPSNIIRFESLEVPENKTQPSDLVDKVPAEPSPIRLKEPTESKEPTLLHKIKSEKVESCATPKQRKTKIQTSSSESSSDSDNDSKEGKPPSTPVQNKTKEISQSFKNIKIKKELVSSPAEKKKAPKEAPPVAAPPSPSTESSSSESSSSDSSEEEENVPKMPKPIKATESVKPKMEKVQEDDVVCLGKQSNIENLIDDDESNEPTPCMVCNKQGHSPHECQAKCKKCSQSGYEIQTVCKNCGETYNQSFQGTPKPPNPFAMFMQFMQFCMSQYSDMSSDIKYPFPQFENPSAPVLGPTPTVEVTRKDIANSKRDRKRTKSGSKHSRKKARMNSDKNSDSDSSSKATTSTKKRKKFSKSASRDVEPPQTTKQPQQQLQLPQFGGHFPANLPFAGGTFGAPGYNPMLAFSQMMGFHPSAMNFTR